MAKLKSKLEQIRERKEKAGEFKVVGRSQVYPIYREINEEMKKFNTEIKEKEKKAHEYASKIVLNV